MGSSEKDISSKYRNDLDSLIKKGRNLQEAMSYEVFAEEYKKAVAKSIKDEKKLSQYLDSLPDFKLEYQGWYSEALALIHQLFPKRVEDFSVFYRSNKPRKELNAENYTISDYLDGITVTRGWEKEKVVGPDAAIPKFRQQLAIVEGFRQRFISTLFDLKLMLQAEVFDNELDAAKNLTKNGYNRAAGAMTGVVLEGHLLLVLDSHGVKITQKDPTIAILNDKLKDEGIIDLPSWRKNQHLADLRNLCDHKKSIEPTAEQVMELIAGVEKVTKNLF